MMLIPCPTKGWMRQSCRWLSSEPSWKALESRQTWGQYGRIWKDMEGWHTLAVIIFHQYSFPKRPCFHMISQLANCLMVVIDMRIKANRLPRRPRPWHHRHCQHLKKTGWTRQIIAYCDSTTFSNYFFHWFSLIVWVSKMFKDTSIACEDRHGSASRGWVRNPWLVGWRPSTELCDDCDGQTPVPRPACVRSETRIEKEKTWY